MKKFLFLLILALYGHVCLAQSIQGYIKTKGRMVNGKVVHGVGLSGVTIRIKGVNVVMSGKGGKFRILLPENHIKDIIYIELISKPGYELIDRDILNRPIVYNPNTPLTIVMEEESILAEERLAIEKKLRRALLLYLENSEREIQESDFTVQEKNRKLQELYNRQSSQERLINDMVNQYGKYDYDAMSMFDLKVTESIINGELEKADSLLNTKGDISDRVNKLYEIRDKISHSDSILQSEKGELFAFADSLHERGKKLLNGGKILDGRECIRQAMDIRRELLGEVSEDYITSLNNYAYSFGAENNWQKAVELQEQVMVLCGKLKTPHKNIGMYTTNMGRYYYFTGNKVKAAKTWEQALPLVDRYGELYELLLNSLGSVYDDLGDQQGMRRIMALMEEHNHHELIKSCDEPKCMLERAQYYETTGNQEEARECYRKVLDMPLDKEMKAQVHEAYASYLGGTIKDFATASDYYLSAANIRRGISGETEVYAMLMYKAGGYAFVGSKYEQSVNAYQAAIAFYRKQVSDATKKNVALCMKGMGNTFTGMKEFSRARECYKELVNYYEQNDQTSEEYPKALLRLAKAEKFNKEYITSIVHHKQAMSIFEERGMAGEYSEAEQSLRLCYVYAENDYSGWETSAQRDYLLQMAEIEDDNYEKTVSIASRFLDEFSDDKNAIKYYNRALEIAVDRSGGLISPDIASIHQNIGNVYNFQGNFTKAIEEYSCAISLQKELMGDSTRHVGQCLMLIGITYNSMKKYDLALDYYRDALIIYENIFKENNSLEIANIYNNMGVAYENKKDNKQALYFYEKALNMRKGLYDYEHPDIAYSYSNIAGVYDHLEEFDKAIAYYQKSIDVLKKSKGSKHLDVGLMYNNIAATYYNMEELVKSLSHFNQALEVMQIFLPEDHPNIRAILENIVIVKNEIGKK